MNNRRRVFFLILIMVAVAAGVAGITLFVLYKAAFEQQRQSLVEIASSQSYLIEAMARFDLQYSAKDIPGGAFAATLIQIKDAHKHFPGFGETGEFTLAKLENNQIVFLLSHRHHDLLDPKPVLFSSKLAEPMRRALSGKSGIIIGIDYRGEKVLAAYEPVKELHLGIVAKIDLVEVRAPFIKAGWLCFGGAFVIVFLGIILFRRHSNPLIQHLEESERKYRTIVDTIGEGIITIDRHSQIQFVNREFCKIFNYTEKELTDQNLLMLIPENFRDAHITGIKRFLEDGVNEAAGGGAKCMEVVGLRKDGTIFPLELRIDQSVYSHQEGVLFTASIRDISERNKMEEELRRTQKLESIGNLAGGIAHDFNNILTGFASKITLAKWSIDKKEIVFQRLTEAERILGSARKLATQLLTFSKGGEPVKKITFVKNILRDHVDLLLAGSNIKCLYNITDDLWPVEVDEGQVGQVITNIVMNSQEAMPDGGEIEIKAENIALKKDRDTPLNTGKYIRIAIEDSGIGISEEILPKIFDLYFTTKRKGNGIGLATCYSIIIKHNGHIDVKPNPGKGVAFIIYLPASTEKLMDNEKYKNETAGYVRNKKILLMEDEKNIRDDISKLLKLMGNEVISMENGEQTIQIYREALDKGRPFDVVIMDLTIPGGMGGKETMKNLLKMDPKVKAVVASGYSDDLIMVEPEKYGFRGVIPKPYNIEELNKVLGQVLKKK